jgi:ABC-type glycerol-3-phosphate transport system permease component
VIEGHGDPGTRGRGEAPKDLRVSAFPRPRVSRPSLAPLNSLLTLWLPLAFFLLFTLAPFYYMLVVSLKDQQAEFHDPTIFPFWVFRPTLDQYIDLFARTQFPRWALNTTLVAVISTLVSLTFGVLAGYALARLRFRGAALLGIISFVTYLVPQTLMFIPLNIVITRLPVPLFLVVVAFSTVAVGLPLFLLLVPPERRVTWGPLAAWLPGILLLGIGVSLGLWGLTAKGAALHEIQLAGTINLSNTLWALVLTYPTFLVPFCTWLLTGFFRSIPRELEESALIDGASRVQAMLRIAVPLAIPGILSAFIFAFTLSWNEYIYALVFLTSTANRTIPVGVVNELIRGDVYFWGTLMAGALLGSVPVAIVYSFFVEHYVAGLTAGAVKG